MFDAIYNFISINLLTTTITDTAVLQYNADLCLLLTHVSIVLIFMVCIAFIRWFFGIASNLVRW